MTDDEMRIAIAEWMGWEPDRHLGDYIHKHKVTGVARFTSELPNYPADLNAVHEAEINAAKLCSKL